MSNKILVLANYTSRTVFAFSLLMRLWVYLNYLIPKTHLWHDQKHVGPMVWLGLDRTGIRIFSAVVFCNDDGHQIQDGKNSLDGKKIFLFEKS